jgi:GNAT superfamily N-acetyltransferase
MIDAVRIDRLSSCPDVIPILVRWFESEWPAWYGPDGRGSALNDLRSYAGPEGLPRGVVAFVNEVVCGTATLKADSIASCAHLSPWAAAALVEPSKRRRGIGAFLLAAIEREALSMGFSRIYCGTSTSRSLLERTGWEFLEDISHEGECVGIYTKAL